MTRSTFVHLRIPFSYFLMPVFLLSACLVDKVDWMNFTISFAIIHLLLYPASNAFNSLYDKDTSSIGCLKNPPKVEKDLLGVSLALDAAAVIAGFTISWQFAAAMLFYGICSKIYSSDKIRLKRRPVASWVGTALVQGGFIFLAANSAVQPGGGNTMPDGKILLAAGIVTIFLMGFYPTTQIYQHAEDRRRGDRTMSMLLGIRGTFIFSGLALLASSALMCMLLGHYHEEKTAIAFMVLQMPAAAYFATWSMSCLKENDKADYDHSMRFNVISATGMTLFCVFFYLSQHHGSF
ncbi:MAG: UbiA family prenyltransferase [Victivallales bacterium]